jgi:putative transposase
VLGVARSNITVRARAAVAKPLGQPPQPVADLVDEIKAVIGEMPTYGYRRVWAVLRRAAKAQGLQPPNHKRIYRVMKAHGLLLQRYAGGAEERRHDGRIAADHPNLRWCSDGFELGCDNGDKVRVAFARLVSCAMYPKPLSVSHSMVAGNRLCS